VKKRIGDRRARGRFEIVGTLTGTLETSRRFGVRNVSAGGALIDSGVPFTPGNRLSGRFSLHGHFREVRGEIRHISAVPERDGGVRYVVGVHWEASTEIEELLSADALRPAQATFKGTERRRSTRLAPAVGEAQFGQPHWSTVELVDISTIGVLFVSPSALEVGERGELRVRLGERSFAAQVEVRRSDTRKGTSTSNRYGAAFVTLDESSRMNLEDFIGDARR